MFFENKGVPKHDVGRFTGHDRSRINFGWFNRQQCLLVEETVRNLRCMAQRPGNPWNEPEFLYMVDTPLFTLIQGACLLEQIDCLMSMLCEELRFYGSR